MNENNEALAAGQAAVSDIGNELAVPMADTPQDLQAAVVLAKQFPRNEAAACNQILHACQRPAFAEAARYIYERNSAKVNGLSVVFAREAARLWTNLRYGYQITGDDLERRKVMAWAWDLEANVRSFAEDVFAKKVPRREHNRTVMKPANERELRELTAARASLMIRNAILTLLPPDLKEDAVLICKTTLTDQAKKQGRADAVPAILAAFAKLGVTREKLEHYLGHPMAKITAEEVADLRAVGRAIRDKTATWAEYCPNTGADGEDGQRSRAQTKPNGKPASALDAFEANLGS